MLAGYDFMLVRHHFQHHGLKLIGIFVAVFGLLMLTAGGAYYVYAAKAHASLSQLNVYVPVSSIDPPMVAVVEPLIDQPASPVEAVSQDVLGPSVPEEVRAFQAEQALVNSFTPINNSQAKLVGSLQPPTRILVPAVGVNTSVTQLAIRDLGDSRTYETPKFYAGHIPESANPGEAGSAWFFGHLNSPVMLEGAVFSELPKIPGLLRRDQNVYVIADNGAQQYLYRVTSTEVVYQDDMKLYDTGRATIHLVTCIPSLVYDYRLVVTGQLVGVK